DTLLLTLKSLFKQTILPDEILVIDDSTDNKTEELLHGLKKRSKTNIIYLKKNPKKRGTTFSRNLGIDKSLGEYLFFLDDDITVYKDYIESSLDFFKKHEDANGIQWYAYSDHDSRYDLGKIKNLFMHLFYLGYYSENKSIVLPSMATVVPHPLTRDIKTEYVGAGTSVFRKSCLNGIRFDEKLTGYALQEDLDFSYRIHKKFGGLYLLKERKLHHAYSLTGRMHLKKITYTKFVYLGYIFKKNIKQSPKNLLIFWWSMFGRLVMRIPNLILRPSKLMLREGIYTYQAIPSMALHFRNLEKNPNYFKEEM
ncbi:MAG: glycosyltransferase, partial [archaeon]